MRSTARCSRTGFVIRGGHSEWSQSQFPFPNLKTMNRPKSEQPTRRHSPTSPGNRARVRAILRQSGCEPALWQKPGEVVAAGRVSCNEDCLEPVISFGRMVTRSSRMEYVFSALRRVADSNATVMLNGETGTGKELAVQALHEAGLRRNSPLIPINCGCLTATLVESQLFGHEKGAFTGALTPSYSPIRSRG